MLALDLAAEVQAADLGQHQIQDDQVHLLAAQQVESFRGPRRLQDAADVGRRGQGIGGAAFGQPGAVALSVVY